ncbi:unnamed protein product [Tuber aestivum]|uniref:Uncharacterized protein n=1 Tax=Tuber aestivum TaxID=59557 RepID=A0A292Q514_9PEZI|nr:unnamed protein product [Tuber aestivum]
MASFHFGVNVPAPCSTWGSHDTKVGFSRQEETDVKIGTSSEHWNLNSAPVALENARAGAETCQSVCYENVITWTDKSKTIGDIVSRIRPGPRGIAMGLIPASATEANEAMVLVGLEKIGSLTDRCTIYQKLYLNSDLFNPTI